MSGTVDGSTFTDDERAYTRAAAAIMAAIAESKGPVPGLNNLAIADLLGWPVERVRVVSRGLRRTGLVATASHIREQIEREQIERAKRGPGAERYMPPEKP